MSFLLPSAQTFQADVLEAMSSFCHYIFFSPTGRLLRLGRKAIPTPR